MKDVAIARRDLGRFVEDAGPRDEELRAFGRTLASRFEGDITKLKEVTEGRAVPASLGQAFHLGGGVCGAN